MPKIAPSTVSEVNERTDIVELINEYTKLERRGSDWWGCCPFHNEKTPSFHVVPDRKMYHCFGCGQGGSVINFYMEMEKLSFVEAVTALAKRSGVEIIYDGNYVPNEPADTTREDIINLYTRVAGSFRYFLLSTDSGAYAREYLEKRGVTPEIAEKFMLGYAPDDRYWLKKFLRSKNYSDEFLAKAGLFSSKYPDVSFFSDRLMFPICDRRGQVIAFGGRILHGEGPKTAKYMNSGDLIQYKKGETLYAFHLAKKSIGDKKAVIFCEGYMDVIAYHQAGITNAVAPLGTALTSDQLKVVSSFADTVILSFDSDRAGLNATYKAILLCRQHGFTVKVIKLEGGKDPADVLLSLGPENLTKQVERAIMDSDYLFSVFSNEYAVDTPEGKTKAALAFFPYIDALQSDIQKESSFELLTRTYGLKAEAVRSDYHNREAAAKRLQQKNDRNRIDKPVHIIPNAEIRAILAVIANTDYFTVMRASLTADDFEDPAARDMFIALEECYRDGSVCYDNILSRCLDEGIKKLVTQAVISGEFSLNSRQAVEDSIQMLRRNSLERRKNRLMNRIRQFSVNSPEDRQQLEQMINEKMTIDFELIQKKDANV